MLAITLKFKIYKYCQNANRMRFKFLKTYHNETTSLYSHPIFSSS